jgi:hypothetical protein
VPKKKKGPFRKPKDILNNWPWPFQRFNFGGAREYACPHGVGHGGVHGCDGCCTHPSYKRAAELRMKDNDELKNSAGFKWSSCTRKRK